MEFDFLSFLEHSVLILYFSFLVRSHQDLQFCSPKLVKFLSLNIIFEVLVSVPIHGIHGSLNSGLMCSTAGVPPATVICFQISIATSSCMYDHTASIFFCFVSFYLFLFISIHPIQVHTMEMEKVSYNLHLQASYKLV